MEHASRYVPYGTQLELETADSEARQRAEEENLPADELRMRREAQPMPQGAGPIEEVLTIQAFEGGALLGQVQPSDPVVLGVLGSLWAEEGLARKKEQFTGRITGRIVEAAGVAAPQV